ncbi:MAG: hypothetical protein ACRC4S_01290, partial [Cetobacterium sp.]
LAEVRFLIEGVIAKTKKSIEREVSVNKELTDDCASLERVIDMQNADEELPVDGGYESYTEWRETLEKEIKSSENSLNRIQIEKAELVAFEYFMDNNPVV